MRTCSRCGEEKAATEFYRENTCADGIRPECKDCSKKAKRRITDNGHNAAYMREYRARPPTWKT